MNNPEVPSVDPSAERSLIEAAAAGSSDARRRLFELHRDAAYQAAFRVTGRAEDALDVVQDAFIRAFERLAEFQQDASFRTWLLRIATNRALDLLRARKVRLAASLDARDDDDERRVDLPSGETDAPDRPVEQQELAARLQAAIDRLPIEQRTVFSLYAAGGMTYGEIAEAVGVPIGTVMSRLFHARRRLQEQLGDLGPRDEEKRGAGRPEV